MFHKHLRVWEERPKQKDRKCLSKHKGRCIDVIKRLSDVSSIAAGNLRQGHIGHIELNESRPSDSVQT